MRFCWHKWGKWGNVVEEFSGSLHQVAKCEKCGAITRRKAVGILQAQLGAGEVNAAIAKAEGAAL